MGNSEVGHLNLGAGRIVYQDLTRISLAVRDQSFFRNNVIQALVNEVRAAETSLHVMGLCSDGGVHSHLDHLFALLDMCSRYSVERVFVHCFTDGRDTPPQSGVRYLEAINRKLAECGVGRIASVVGRYFAMDRDNRWERVAKAYAALVAGVGRYRDDAPQALREWYVEGVTDEFIPPTIIAADPKEISHQLIKDGDGVVFFNFRSDRARELTTALTQPSFKGFARSEFPKSRLVCMTEYDATLGLPIAFPPQRLVNTLAEVVAGSGMRQLRIAETEKYPHVTFFFNGGVEPPVPGEDRCLIPSPKVATYDLQPEMSAPEVTKEVVARIKSGTYDLIILNYANPDMVGHTGCLKAAIEAVEVTDRCVGQVLEAVEQAGGAALVTADHGNAEKMLDAAGGPFTAHTANPVHVFYYASDQDRWTMRSGILADIAPTILELLGLTVPPEMTGRSLLIPR